MLCPPCWARRRLIAPARYEILLLAAGCLGYVLLWLDPVSVPGWFLTRWFLLNLFLILALALHELGHAIGGWLAGLRVFSVIFGRGRTVLKFRLFGTVVVFNWLVDNAVTRWTPINAEWFRTKRFVIIIAGPAVNAAMMGTILWFWRTSVHKSGFLGLPHLARFCFVANLLAFAVTLWPWKSKKFGRASDGMQLIKTFSKTKKDVDRLLADRFAFEATMRRDECKDPEGALKWCNEGLALFPCHSLLLNMRAALFLDVQDYRRARESFLQLLSDQTKPCERRYSILSNIAYADAMIGDRPLLPEADAYSKEAYAALPWDSSIVGTRGIVLVEIRKYEEGIALLKESFEAHQVPRHKALNACSLAIAHSKLGNNNQAREYLNLARQHDPRCSLLERAEAEF